MKSNGLYKMLNSAAEKQRLVLIEDFLRDADKSVTAKLGDKKQIRPCYLKVPLAVGHRYHGLENEGPGTPITISREVFYVLGISRDEQEILLLSERDEAFWDGRGEYVHVAEA